MATLDLNPTRNFDETDCNPVRKKATGSEKVAANDSVLVTEFCVLVPSILWAN